jgi:hexosaminidase
MFPRLIAFAERAWHRAPWESSYKVRTNVNEDFPVPDFAARDADWSRVASMIGHRELKRLEAYGVNPRIPPPGARYCVTMFAYNDKKNTM